MITCYSRVKNAFKALIVNYETLCGIVDMFDEYDVKYLTDSAGKKGIIQMYVVRLLMQDKSTRYQMTYK